MAAVEAGTLKRTPLYEAHVEAGAKLVDFAGWEMPVQYDGIKAEHLRVRQACGVFDVSHMGEIETEGPQAADLLQRLLSNDVSKIQVGGAQYSCLCREDGGVLDDLFTYRIADERYLTVTNAANHERDLEWFEAHVVEFEAEVRDRIDAFAMLAVQGPRAREIVGRLADGELPARFRTAELAVAGAPTLVCGTGYTGEDGVELLTAAGAARASPATRRASALATPSASRSTTASTETTSPRSGLRSRPGSAGASRRTRASSAPRRAAGFGRRGRRRSSSPS